MKQIPFSAAILIGAAITKAKKGVHVLRDGEGSWCTCAAGAGLLGLMDTPDPERLQNGLYGLQDGLQDGFYGRQAVSPGKASYAEIRQIKAVRDAASISYFDHYSVNLTTDFDSGSHTREGIAERLAAIGH